MTKQAGSKVCVGVISGAHGVRGEVKVATFTETPDGLTAYGPLQDKSGNRTFDLSVVRVNEKHLVCRIKGVGDRDVAGALRGTELYVARDQMPELEDGVWYYSDLEGLAVHDPDGTIVGNVLAVQNYGAGDLLEIDMSGAKSSVLILFSEENVPDIDITNGLVRLAIPIKELTGD